MIIITIIILTLTTTEFEDNYLIKLFAFFFVNSYSSFLYLAFIAGYLPTPSGSPSGTVGDCGYDTCMKSLEINVLIVFIARVFQGLIQLIWYQVSVCVCVL